MRKLIYGTDLENEKRYVVTKTSNVLVRNRVLMKLQVN